jgi:hypothetical protein
LILDGYFNAKGLKGDPKILGHDCPENLSLMDIYRQ